MNDYVNQGHLPYNSQMGQMPNAVQQVNMNHSPSYGDSPSVKLKFPQPFRRKPYHLFLNSQNKLQSVDGQSKMRNIH